MIGQGHIEGVANFARPCAGYCSTDNYINRSVSAISGDSWGFSRMYIPSELLDLGNVMHAKEMKDATAVILTLNFVISKHYNLFSHLSEKTDF